MNLSSDTWVISDTHFQHDNIIKFCNRPFANSKEMDEALIHNWNSTVKPTDIIYHLGDISFGDKNTALDIMYNLNGHKRLIVGNHDDVPFWVRSRVFEKVVMLRWLPEFGLLLTHVPVHESQLETKRMGNHMINVHGHIHDQDSPQGPYRNVSVEKIEYRPINIDELRTI